MRLLRGSKADRYNIDDNITVEDQIFDSSPPIIIVYPHAVVAGSSAPKTTTVSGRYKIRLKQAEPSITAIEARLVPKYLALTKHVKDRGELPAMSCKIAVPESMDGGVHELPFFFDLPCTAWPRSHIVNMLTENNHDIQIDDFDDGTFIRWYSWELRISRRLANGMSSVFVHESPNKSLVTPKNGLVWEKFAKAWLNTYHYKTIVVITSPSEPGEMPPPLERVIEEWSPQSGPINLVMTSRCFTVGALLNINLVLPALPTTTEVRQIRMHAVQHQTFDSPTLSTSPFKAPSVRMTFWRQGPPFDRDGSTLTLNASTRLPDHRFLSASTLKHTINPYPMTHELVLEIELLDENKKKKSLNVRTPVVVAHCMLISEWLSLPKYGEDAQPETEFQPERLDKKYCCACGFTLEQLVERESEGILPDEAFEQVEVKPREDR